MKSFIASQKNLHQWSHMGAHKENCGFIHIYMPCYKGSAEKVSLIHYITLGAALHNRLRAICTPSPLSELWPFYFNDAAGFFYWWCNSMDASFTTHFFNSNKATHHINKTLITFEIGTFYNRMFIFELK